MKFLNLVVWLVVLSLSPLALADESEAACPDQGLGETAQDCPWAGIARSLSAAGAEHENLATLLEEQAPGLVRQLQTDAREKRLASLWGLSINFDELAKGQIVDPAILDTLGGFAHIAVPELAHKTVPYQVVPAGLEHTYGYLFSVLKTSFGYKRARWVQGEVERGFGLPAGMLSPLTAKGTLLSNVTYFAGRIAFRDSAKMTRALKRTVRKAAREVKRFDYSALKPIRLVETVEVKGEDGSVRVVTLRTDLVPFIAGPQTPEEGKKGNTHLLVYSIDEGQGPRLITAFPVESSFRDMVVNPANLGDSKPVITRYNGYVDGLSGLPAVNGKRELHGY